MAPTWAGPGLLWDYFVNKISRLYTSNSMGRKRDLTTIEKDQIVKLLSNQKLHLK